VRRGWIETCWRFRAWSAPGCSSRWRIWFWSRSHRERSACCDGSAERALILKKVFAATAERALILKKVSSPATDSDSERAARADLETIYRAAVAAVDPARLVGRAMDGCCHGAEQVPDLIAGASRVFMLAVGKAAAGMAREIERRIGDKLADAIAVIPRAATSERALILKTVRVLASSHPVPDESSEAAARAACEMLHGAA